MPAYLRNALPADDAARLAAHVVVCADCAFELELERHVAALLEPAHEDAQFERLWARIATATPRRVRAATGATLHRRRRRPSVSRRWIGSIAAVAATLLLGGGGIEWYGNAAAPGYATLADSPRHACGSLRIRALDANAAGAAIDVSGARVIDGPDADGIYTLAAPDPIAALHTLRAAPGIRLAEPTDC
jgi:hypothetical protein